jgi:hypothetical protein
MALLVHCAVNPRRPPMAAVVKPMMIWQEEDIKCFSASLRRCRNVLRDDVATAMMRFGRRGTEI